MREVSIAKFATQLHFKKMTADDLRNSGSFNLVDDDGCFVAILVVPASAEKKGQFQALCGQMNAALGKE